MAFTLDADWFLMIGFLLRFEPLLLFSFCLSNMLAILDVLAMSEVPDRCSSGLGALGGMMADLKLVVGVSGHLLEDRATSFFSSLAGGGVI